MTERMAVSCDTNVSSNRLVEWRYPIALIATVIAACGALTISCVTFNSNADQLTTSRDLEAKLSTVAAVDFRGVPFVDAISELSSRFDVDIKLDEKEIVAWGVPLETNINFSFDRLTLRSVLNLLLEPLGLAFVPQDNSLLITSSDSADALVQSRKYSVRNLVDSVGDMDDLVEILTAVVSYRPVIASSLDSRELDICVDHARHETIDTSLQRMRNPLPRDRALEQWGAAAEDRQINRMLLRKTSLNVKDMPFRQVIDQFSKRHNLPILIDQIHLADAGISQTQKVSINIRDVSLQSVLAQLTGVLDLTFLVKNEVIKIVPTDIGFDYGNYQLWAYDVSDLVSQEVPDWYDPTLGKLEGSRRLAWAKSTPAAIALIELIETLPVGWSGLTEGQPGSVYYFAPTQSLVIHHHQHAHRMVAKLLGPPRRIPFKKPASSWNADCNNQSPSDEDAFNRIVCDERSAKTRSTQSELDSQSTAEKRRAPGSVLDLSRWRLTLPVDQDQSGRPDEIRQPKLEGFELKPHFHVTAQKDGVIFRAHCGGTPTKNTQYPRVNFVRCLLMARNEPTGIRRARLYTRWSFGRRSPQHRRSNSMSFVLKCITKEMTC